MPTIFFLHVIRIEAKDKASPRYVFMARTFHCTSISFLSVLVFFWRLFIMHMNSFFCSAFLSLYKTPPDPAMNRVFPGIEFSISLSLENSKKNLRRHRVKTCSRSIVWCFCCLRHVQCTFSIYKNGRISNRHMIARVPVAVSSK